MAQWVVWVVSDRSRLSIVPAAAVTAAALFVLFLADLAAVESGTTAAGDRSLERSIHHLFGLADFPIFQAITNLGGPVVRTALVVLLVLLLARVRRWRSAVLLVLIVEGSGLVEEIAKLAVRRPRPHLFAGAQHADGYSFPSGHSMGTFALCVALAAVLWPVVPRAARAPLAVVLALFTVLVGLSRVVLGVHYPTDVAGGFLLAGAWSAVVLAFSPWLGTAVREGRDGGLSGGP